jgi:hypothetical protein
VIIVFVSVATTNVVLHVARPHGPVPADPDVVATTTILNLTA